jgi:hypothetical protein
MLSELSKTKPIGRSACIANVDHRHSCDLQRDAFLEKSLLKLMVQFTLADRE